MTVATEKLTYEVSKRLTIIVYKVCHIPVSVCELHRVVEGRNDNDRDGSHYEQAVSRQNCMSNSRRTTPVHSGNVDLAVDPVRGVLDTEPVPAVSVQLDVESKATYGGSTCILMSCWTKLNAAVMSV